MQGPELFKVERRVVIREENPRLQLMDRVTNISQGPQKPDWGYHITFFPSDGSSLLVPSISAENRSGEKVPEDFDRWSPAQNSEIREETGIIHKGLETHPSKFGDLGFALVTHPEGTGIKVSFPASPYFQTWFCKGGANSREFTRVSDGKPLFSTNWDGIGIEFGSSALDHDGNTDQLVPEQGFLEPGSSMEIPMLFDLLYEKYSRNLYNFCCSLLKTHEDAEGVVEEVFLRVWKKRSELLEQKSFKIFLFQLAYTVFIDHFSERSEDPEYEQFVILQAQRYYLDPDKKVEKDHVEKRVKKPVDELSENWM